MNVPVSQEFRVHNPSDHPLSLRLLPLPLDDGSMEGALAIGTFKGADWAARVEAFGRGKEFSLGPGAGEVVVVPPHSEALVGPVVFKPSAQREHTALLLLKNNLTLLQVRVARLLPAQRTEARRDVLTRARRRGDRGARCASYDWPTRRSNLTRPGRSATRSVDVFGPCAPG